MNRWYNTDRRVSYDIFDLSPRRLAWLFSGMCLFAFGIWGVNNLLPYKNIWDSYRITNNISTIFCEKTIMANIVRQPVNTFSNFIYWMVAITILRRGWKDQSSRHRYNIISINPMYSILFGGILLYIFIASSFYHSSLIKFASRIDFSAVYSLSLFPLMYFTHRVWLLVINRASNDPHPLSMRTMVVAFTVGYLLLTFYVDGKAAHYTVLTMILLTIVFALVVENKDRGKTNIRYLAISIFSILFAVVCFIIDNLKLFCNPDSILQPHSAWHLLSGISSFYFYMYIRSERNKL